MKKKGMSMARRPEIHIPHLTRTPSEGSNAGSANTLQIWRPIKPIHKDPLAVCDARTVSDADLVPGSIILKSGQRRESWTVKPNPEHQWYFKYQQQPDEVVLIKCFDSNSSAEMARRAPHCAVEDPDAKEGEWRESVEVRCLVFW